MRWRVVAILVGVGACSDDAGIAESRPGIDVVMIDAQRCDRPTVFHGVGTVIGDGVIVTAAHVVDGDLRSLTVDGLAAGVLAIDERTDLAVLQVDGLDGSAALSASVGAQSATVMTPSGSIDAEVITTGLLDVHDASAGEVHRREVHTFAPAVPEGTSGAPLVDDRGAVMGVVILADDDKKLAYAVTASEVAQVVARQIVMRKLLPRSRAVLRVTPTVADRGYQRRDHATFVHSFRCPVGGTRLRSDGVLRR